MTRNNLTHLPIDDVMDDVVGALRDNPSLVLQAPAGAGKTTRVPPALLDAGLAGDGRILVLEPRRVAARATAKRIAYERGVSVGGEVGYQVRFDNRISDQTRLAIITEGILTRRLQSDPFLDGVSIVVLDEFHERSVHTDLAIAFLKEVQEVRDDLKIVVMSATIATKSIADYLDCPVVESEGRTYPVDIEYLDQPPGDDLEVEAARAVRRLIEDPEDDGDVLVFMPGAGSIHRTIDALGGVERDHDVEVLPLYGALSPQKQDRAIEPAERQRVIVSTNIAETSLTIEGVTGVVDAGKVKQMEMAPASGLDKLETKHVSMASAEQRAGRAGRVRPGRAVRLWTRAFEHRLEDFDTPEIMRVDVTAPILEVLAWSGSDPMEFDWFDRPPAHAIERAVELLRSLGAVEADGFVLTDLGRKMLELPAHPRIARMLVEGAERGVLRTTAGMAAVLSERDFVLHVDQDAPPGDSDLLRRVDLLDQVSSGRRGGGRSGMKPHYGRAKRVAQVQRQFERLLDNARVENVDPDAPLKALAVGYPDRVCISRGDDRRYVMLGGEPLALAYESIVHDADFLIAASIGGRVRGRNAGGVSSRGLIRMASLVRREWLEELFPEKFEARVEVEFDEQRERVMAFEREFFGDIQLGEKVVSVEDAADPQAVSRLLASRARQDLEAAFGMGERDLQFIERLKCLREWMPELDMPNLAPDAEAGRFDEILTQLCWGKRTFDELRRVDLPGALKNYLNHEQISALEHAAPPEMVVPSGKTRQITYRAGKPPVLEVRIQEMFGTTRTPTVADGRVKILLHLLAPNFRPQQITDDLAGFWENTYPEVRKDLRARYSKHPWPEDPANAKPVAK
ncbi:MAG: ATP-dependent helicase HrpB [Myxococcota bacterium]